MERLIEEFIHTLRGAGVRVSVAESLDAVRAVETVGYGHRETLKYSLAAVLAKSAPEKLIFANCFDRFFASREFPGRAENMAMPVAAQARDRVSPLSRMILAGDNAGIMAAMRGAFREADILGVQYFTQRGSYIRAITSRLGFDEVGLDIQRLQEDGSFSAARTARFLDTGRDRLWEQVKNLAERQFAMFIGMISEAEDNYLKSVRLTTLEHRDFQRMQVLIQKILKRLNAVYTRRQRGARRGLLDLKKTLRKNVAYHGAIVEPRLRKKRIARPDIVAICDVSRSVETVSRFMLLFLYGLNRALNRIRTFVFCSNLVEASPVFERCSLEKALARIHAGAGLGVRYGLTDYGQALQDFKDNWFDSVTGKTTVLILGDARNNYGDHRAEILAEMQKKCKRIIWLNPENKASWGTGDSVMSRYQPHCHLARECGTVQHLEEVVRELLKGIR